MRAAIFRRSTQDSGQYLEIGDIPRPTILPGHSLLRVIACGVCRTDLHIVTGELPALRPELIPGHQIVGEVIDGATPQFTHWNASGGFLDGRSGRYVLVLHA